VESGDWTNKLLWVGKVVQKLWDAAKKEKENVAFCTECQFSDSNNFLFIYLYAVPPSPPPQIWYDTVHWDLVADHFGQWHTQEFCSGGGGSTNSVEDRENGDLRAVAP